jgi:hypothetical protein
MATNAVVTGQEEKVHPIELSRAAPNQQNILNRYVELLPDSNHAWWQTAYNAFSTMIFVAFLLIAVGVTLFVGLNMAMYLPVAGVSLYSFVPLVYNGFAYVRQLAAQEGALAEVENGIAEKLEGLETDDYNLFSNRLRPLQIQLTQIEGYQPDQRFGLLTRLRPVIARYLYWRDRAQTLSTRAEQLIARAQPADLRKKQLEALKLQENAQIAKAFAAYFRGVVLNPFLAHDWQGVFQLPQLPPMEYRLIERGLADVYHDRLQERFLTYPDNAPRFTMQEVQGMTDIQLCQHFFGAPQRGLV